MTDRLADVTPSLVARFREGDSLAGEELVRMYRTRLVRFCVGYLGDHEEAEDVVQDVFLRVLRSDTVPGSFRSWVYKVCRNRCLDILRSRTRRRDDRDLPPDSLLEAVRTGYLTRLVKKEQESRLRRLLEELSAHQREVLKLRYSEDLSRAEIAEVLDLSESVVKSRLYEGLQVLRRHESIVER